MRIESKFNFGDKIRCIWAGDESPIYYVDGFSLNEGGSLNVRGQFFSEGEIKKIDFLESEIEKVTEDIPIGFKNDKTRS